MGISDTVLVLALLKFVPSHDVFNGSSQDVAIVRQTSGKRWAVIERVDGLVSVQLNAGLEGILLLPVLEDDLFVLGEAWSLRYWVHWST